MVEASEQVVANSTTGGAGLRVDVVNGRPLARLRRRPGRPAFDVAFTVFGPDYGPRRARRTLVGCADVTSVFPEFSGIHGLRPSLVHAVRRRVSRRIFRRADRIVAESAHVTAALHERWGIDESRLRVVPNVLNRVFDDPSQQTPLPAGVDLDGAAVFAYPTRAYPHKNLGVLGAARRIAAEGGGPDIRFALTLTDAEWEHLDPATRAASTNVGPLTVAQVPALYAACTGVVFPSLNECFSVTPLEALRAGRTLVASDRPSCARSPATPRGTSSRPIPRRWPPAWWPPCRTTPSASGGSRPGAGWQPGGRPLGTGRRRTSTWCRPELAHGATRSR